MPVYNLEEQILGYIKAINNEWYEIKKFEFLNHPLYNQERDLIAFVCNDGFVPSKEEGQFLSKGIPYYGSGVGQEYSYELTVDLLKFCLYSHTTDEYSKHLKLKKGPNQFQLLDCFDLDLLQKITIARIDHALEFTGSIEEKENIVSFSLYLIDKAIEAQRKEEKANRVTDLIDEFDKRLMLKLYYKYNDIFWYKDLFTKNIVDMPDLNKAVKKAMTSLTLNSFENLFKMKDENLQPIMNRKYSDQQRKQFAFILYNFHKSNSQSEHQKGITIDFNWEKNAIYYILTKIATKKFTIEKMCKIITINESPLKSGACRKGASIFRNASEKKEQRQEIDEALR